MDGIREAPMSGVVLSVNPTILTVKEKRCTKCGETKLVEVFSFDKSKKDGRCSWCKDWNKFMAGEIHIDHIIPISAFNYEKPEDDDFKRCWCLENLQPLWATDNHIKKAKIDKPFQPSLIF